MISANIEANGPLLSSHSTQESARNPQKDVSVAALRWGENLEHLKTTTGGFDLILGSDIVYEPHCFAPLVEVVMKSCLYTFELNLRSRRCDITLEMARKLS